MEYWNNTITVYHCIPEELSEKWQRRVISGAFFKSTVTKTAQGTALSMANSFLARLPVGVKVQEGDIIVAGNVKDEIGGAFTIAKLLQKYKDRAFRIRHYSDNSHYNPAHIKCEG